MKKYILTILIIALAVATSFAQRNKREALADSLTKKGQELYEAGKYDDAIDALDEAIETDRRAGMAYYYRGLAHQAEEDFEEALDDINQVTRIERDFIEAVVEKGKTLYMMGGDENIEDAIREFEDAIEENKELKEAWYYLGLIYFEQKNYDKAAAHFMEAIQLDNNYRNAYYYRAKAYYELNARPEAKKDLDRLVDMDTVPDADVHNMRGQINFRNNNYKGAIDDYTIVLNKNAENLEALYNRGLSYYELEQYNEAIADFTKAIDVDKKNANYWYYRAKAKYELGDEIEDNDYCDDAKKAKKYGSEDAKYFWLDYCKYD